MSQRILVVRKGDEEHELPLNKERVVIGRDKTCDLVLDDRALSRQHLAVVFRYGAIYVENLSTTGYLEKNGQQTEYAELHVGDEIHFGPFVLALKSGKESFNFLSSKSGSKNSIESDDFSLAVNPSIADQRPKTNPELAESTSLSGVNEATNSDSAPKMGAITANHSRVDQDFPISPNSEMASAEGEFDQEKNTQLGADSEERSSEELSYSPPSSPPAAPAGFALNEGRGFSIANGTVPSKIETRVSGSSPRPRLKVAKGEEVGREIRLESGSSWVIGRSKRATIVINHPSVSRQHFKIVKIQDKYRVQDLGSARGVKINGVTVTDSPLSPFDTILVGKVELQFLLVDEALAHMNSADLLDSRQSVVNASALNFLGDASSQISKQETQPHVPLPAISGLNLGGRVENKKIDKADLPNMNSVESSGDIDDLASAEEDSDDSSLVAKLKALPPRTRALALGAVAVVIFGIVFLSLEGGETEDAIVYTPPKPQIENPKPTPPAPPSPENPPNNAANDGIANQDPTIDPKFYGLPRSDRESIENLYVETERAIREEAWDRALRSASEILGKIERFKKTKDYLLEAQSAMGQLELPSMDPQETSAQLAGLLEKARTAVNQEDWATAKDYATKAINLDPTNLEALDLLQAAESQKASARYDGGTNEDIAPSEGEDPERQKHFDYLAALTAQFRQATDYQRAGEFSRSIPLLIDLGDKVYAKMQEQRANRSPAAYSRELVSELQALSDQINSNYDSATEQLKSEYQTQLADASQFLQNRQYVQAREIYDAILLKEPHFDEAKTQRLRLYDRIIVEARRLYQEALIAESVGDLKAAADNLTKTVELLTNVRDLKATEYYQKSTERLQRLQR